MDYNITAKERLETALLIRLLTEYDDPEYITPNLIQAKVFLAIQFGFPEYYSFNWCISIHSSRLKGVMRLIPKNDWDFHIDVLLHEPKFKEKYQDIIKMMNWLRRMKAIEHPEISDKTWFSVLAYMFHWCKWYISLNLEPQQVKQDIHNHFINLPEHIVDEAYFICLTHLPYKEK